jgi:hypothetical protein
MKVERKVERIFRGIFRRLRIVVAGWYVDWLYGVGIRKPFRVSRWVP